MIVLAVVLLALSCLFAGALVFVHLYGAFARRARGAAGQRLPIGPPETALDQLIAPLVGSRARESGLMLVDDNLDAFALRALSARQAGRSLDLLYYMWKGDLSGRLLAGELLGAADRGVRVRLLLDDLNAHKYDKTTVVLDQHPNIEVRLFNPTRNREGAFWRGLEMAVRLLSVSRRMHNKAWIADGRLAVVGGRNIGDDYFDAGAATSFRDLDLLVLGHGVDQAARVFDTYWNSAAVLPVRALRRPRRRKLARLRARLDAFRRSPGALPYLERTRGYDSLGRLLARGRVHWAAKAEILADPPEKAMRARRAAWLSNFTRATLAEATGDLDIISPYFVPRPDGSRALLDLVQRGVRVRVLTNSLAATDVMAVHGAYARYRRPLLEGGVALFELKPYSIRRRSSVFGSSSASLHTKAFTVDGRIGFVGSMNFDPRSASLNCEMGIRFEQPALVEEMQQVIAELISPLKSYRLRLEGGRLLWETDTDQPALPPEPGASRWRRLATRVIGLLPIESQL